MVNITKETWGENGVEVIVLNGIKWFNEKNMEEHLKHAYLRVITRKYPSKYKKTSARISKLWHLSALQNIFKRKTCNKSNNGL